MDDLLWLGLGWDEGIEAEGERGPYRRSQRLPLYLETAEDLVRRGLARRDAARTIMLTSKVAGSPGGFELIRQDGTPDDDFATAVDDQRMGITHVVSRPDEALSLSRQGLAHAALGLEQRPELIRLAAIDLPGEISAGRGGTPPAIERLRQEGYPPEAVLNLLAHLGAATNGAQDVLTREEMLAGFDPSRAAGDRRRYDPRRLSELALRHMARMAPGRLADLAAEHLVSAGLLSPAPSADECAWAGAVARLHSERLARMSDLPALAEQLFHFDPCLSLANEAVVRGLRDPLARRVIETLLTRWGRQGNDQELTAVRFHTLVNEVRRATGAKGGPLYDTLRIALTGHSEGPDLAQLIALIERGRRLPLPQRVAGCAERAKCLLEATAPGAPGDQ